jgi:hypothetical protein
MKKTKSLEKEIDKIMRHYAFDPYGKNAYIKNVSKAIVKVVLEMVQTPIVDSESEELLDNISDAYLRQMIRRTILGEPKI